MSLCKFWRQHQYFLLDCGNHPGQKATSLSSKRLGTVNLATGETHLSCRRHCQTSYPAFRYYHQLMANSKECICFTDDEEVIQIEKSEDTNFGYADSCGKCYATCLVHFLIILFGYGWMYMCACIFYTLKSWLGMTTNSYSY